MMEHVQLDSFIDSVESWQTGDLVGFVAIEEQFARLKIPVQATAWRGLRKKLAGFFAAEIKEADPAAFLRLLARFARDLQDLDQLDAEGARQRLAELGDALQEYQFDRVHRRTDGLYPPGYLDNLVDNVPLLEKFVEEAREHLQLAQLSLLEIETDPGNQEALNTLFRAFHTIKGSSGFLGIKTMEDLAHEYENLLSLIREGQLKAGSEVIDIVFYAIKFLEDLVDILPASAYQRQSVIESFLLRDISPMLQIARNIVRQYKTHKIGEILADMGRIAPGIVDEILRKQHQTGERFGIIAEREGLASPEDIALAVSAQKNQKEQAAMVKVSAARLNAIVDLAGELVIIQSMIREGLRQNDLAGVEKTREQLESVSASLKEMALSMGMVPVTDLFNRLRVVVRNTARDLGRQISFTVQGEDTELDRKLMDALYDPLVHMVRNAIDHGIEPPAERQQAGKAGSGRLSVSAQHRSNGVEVCVEDDGRGIDPDRVVAVALARQLISEEQAVQLRQNPAECWNLLFLPGFSTKAEVTGISGRGVGLDVVKTNVEAVGGRLDIWSKPGKGTRITLRIPLSLAIMNGFVCRVRQRTFVIPFAALEEVLIWPLGRQSSLVRGGADFSDGGHAVMEYRDEFLRVQDARSIFLFGDSTTLPAKRPLLVLRNDEHLFGLVVDEALGEQEIVIKSLDEMMERIPCISGGSIFGDGSIGFVIDMNELATTLSGNRSGI